MTIYFDNSYTKWEKVMVHYWGKETTVWPGKELAKVSDSENQYQIELPAGTIGLVLMMVEMASSLPMGQIWKIRQLMEQWQKKAENLLY